MSPAVISITIVAYFIILFTISYIAGRKADNEGFFVGNRKSAWYVVAFAMIGSTISGVTFVSVPGMVQASSFSYLQMVLGFIVGQFIIAFVLVPLFYRMNLVSIYEYLENRFGASSYKTGAWFFFISKMLGAAVRLFLVCLTLQLLIFEPFHLPFLLNVILTVFIVWLYTFRGGVKSLIWTDVLKTFCLVVSVILCIYYIASNLHLNFSGLITTISDSDFSKTFFFDDVNDKRYFFKQFLAGVFTVIAMNGLDQDMMQRNLSCKNFRDSQKNIVTSGILQLFVILLFLMPYASMIPMTCLAAILIMVAYNMSGFKTFGHMIKTAPKSDILVLITTLLLTVFFDLVVAIEIGMVMAAFLFMKRMSDVGEVKP